MPTYIVTRKTDGAEVYRYSASTPIEWQGFEFATCDHVAQPDPVPPPQQTPPQQVWPLTYFLLRFTQAERIAAKTKRTTDAVLDDLWTVLESSPEIHSYDPVLRQGMGYLVQLGLVTVDRMHAILGDI